MFHRVKCTAAAMLDRALFELWENAEEDEIVGAIFHLSDEQLLDECVSLAQRELNSPGVISKSREQSLRIAISQLRRLRNRELFKELWTRTKHQLGPGQLGNLRRTYGGEGGANRKAAHNRSTVSRTLEIDFGLEPGSIAIYCAEAKAKIAEVAIAIEDQIAPFSDYEQQNEARLSGGHLIAQVERFKNLWRIQVFIERSEKLRLRDKGMLDTLVNAVGAVLLPEGTPEEKADRMRSIALLLAEDPSLPYYGRTVLKRPIVQAGIEHYPSGVPSIRAFFADLGEQRHHG